MVTGDIEKLEVITTDGNISEPFKNFKINPEIDFTLLEPSILSLQSLSTGIYSDTKITRVESFSAMKKLKLIPQELKRYSYYITIELTNELLSVVWKSTHQNAWSIPVIPYSGQIIAGQIANLRITRTSSSGSLTVTFVNAGTSYETAVINFKATTGWKGTVDSSEAFVKLTMRNFVDNNMVILEVPLRIELQF